jgi:hypothetical protein
MAGNKILDKGSKFKAKEKPIRNKSSKFSEQNVDLAKTPLFFPAGFEKVFLTIYFITLPYITGLLFQFFYIADGRIELYLSLSENSSFIFAWAIGYEILATMTILYIIKMAISFSRANSRTRQTIQRP